jgi:hypothetical protein
MSSIFEERVAMAIADASEPWRLGQQTDAKAHYFALARAAIEAMREPTEEMLQCGFDTHQSWNLGDKDDLAAAWRGMIDAAIGKLSGSGK